MKGRHVERETINPAGSGYSVNHSKARLGEPTERVLTQPSSGDVFRVLTVRKTLRKRCIATCCPGCH